MISDKLADDEDVFHRCLKGYRKLYRWAFSRDGRQCEERYFETLAIVRCRGLSDAENDGDCQIAITNTSGPIVQRQLWDPREVLTATNNNLIDPLIADADNARTALNTFMGEILPKSTLTLQYAKEQTNAHTCSQPACRGRSSPLLSAERAKWGWHELHEDLGS